MSSAWKRALMGLAVGILAAPLPAEEPGNTLYSLGIAGRGYGMGGAFAAIADDVTATAWNPAGLAYLTRPEFQVMMRSMSDSNTAQFGSVANTTSITESGNGSQKVDFFGAALPLGKNGRGLLRGGTLGFAFWKGGFYENHLFAARLTSGDPDSDLEIRPRVQDMRSMVDYFTVAYGWQPSSAKLKFGIGLVYAQQSFDFNKTETIVDPNDPGNPLGTTTTQINETGSGVGAHLGVIGKIEGGRGNFGATFRSEIKLSDFGAADTFAEKIPAQLSGSLSYVLREVKRGETTDYLLGAVQVDHFFAANGGLTAATSDFTNFGLGLSYSLSWRGASIPVRVGFHNYQSGGSSLFSNEQVFTFGLGWRPTDSLYSIDLDFGSSNRHSGMDVSLAFGYRFGED